MEGVGGGRAEIRIVEPKIYLLDVSHDPDTLCDVISRGFPVQRRDRERIALRFFDTFDWRLFGRGYQLCLSNHRRCPELELRSRRGVVHTSRDHLEPGFFAWDLPPGRLRDAISPIIEVRSLLEHLRLKTHAHRLNVLNRDDKTVAVAQVERWTADRVGGVRKRHTLPPMLRIVPVKGYRSTFRRLARFIETELGLRPSPSSLFAVAAQTAGLEPGAYSAKRLPAITPEMRAEAAARALHQALFETIQLNLPGVRHNLDSEFLHDFRVSVRRIRTALAQLKHVFPADELAHFKQEFRWLGKTTGPVRDLDVYRLRMNDYRAELPEDARKHIEPLDRYLREHHRIEHRRLVKALDSARFRKLGAAWTAFLENPVDEDETSYEAASPIIAVASQRIWRTYRTVYRKGRKIKASTAPEALHELRIEGKKLRYLLELFRGLYPEDQMQLLIAALKRLQDNLGNFNDFEVQQDSLRQFAHEMEAEGLAPVDTLLAMGTLVEHLRQRQARARRQFAASFTAFSAEEPRKAFLTLFKSRSS